MAVWSEFWRIFSLVFLVTAIPVAILIVLEKRSPFKTIAWILVLILLPVIGVIFYLFFGQEIRKRKQFSRMESREENSIRELAEKQLEGIIKEESPIPRRVKNNENTIKLLLNNSGSLLTENNRIEILNSGEITFNAISDTIEKAVHHIHLEYYIFSDDKIGNKISAQLIKKKKEGVEVRLLIDDVGSWSLSKKFISGLKSHGIQVYSSGEVRFPRLTSKVNFRNHRKILIADGKTAITGGSNIADRYLYGVERGPWYDMNLKIGGDAVACLQDAFLYDWRSTTGEELPEQKYLSLSSAAGGIPVQIVSSGPETEWENISQACFSAIAGAKKNIYLVTPYLMPPSSLLTALKTAALSKVDVRVLIPEKSDAVTPRWASFSYVAEMLEAGVKVHFHQHGFIHSKYLIVDDTFTTIGTTNFDFRSFETNSEVNVFVYDESFTGLLKKQFFSDLANSREILPEEWILRPWHFKLRESLAHIAAPMM